MAAPTDVRVEAQSITSTILRWTYPGLAGIAVFRSTDGLSYSEVTAFPNVRVPTGTVTYTDTGLAPRTRYWYKLSDDGGGTFSSVVTVVTHTCLSPSGSLDVLTLPRFDGSEQQSSDLNNMAERIESALGDRVLEPEQCIACPENGAVVIDCSNGCIDWVVIADEDINSISVQWCEGPPGTVEFIIPPNTSGRQICGWPAGFGFTGDECNKAPITSGAFGTSISAGIGGAGGQGTASNPSSRRGYNPGSRSGGGSGGGSGCTCVPGANGALTIKSCNNNNSLNCTSTKTLKLLVCGGRGPYTWSKTGSISLKGAGPAGATATGTSISVTPPTNSGSAVVGVAYWTSVFDCATCNTTCTDAGGSTGAFTELHNCDDSFTTCTTTSFCSPAPTAHQCCSGATILCNDTTCGASLQGSVKSCDQRTAPMIAAGCNPCGLQAGATVSVTDAAGVTTTVILRA